MPEIDRNTISGFAERTWKNYFFIERMHTIRNRRTHCHPACNLTARSDCFPYEHKKD
jgi:hypothetical protein